MANARMGAPKIIAAMVLWLGLGACSAANDQGSGEHRTFPKIVGISGDEETSTVTSFDVLESTDVADFDNPTSELQPGPVETLSAIIILCSLQVDNPHKSSHVPGAVNVVARLNCSSAVSGIEMTVGLERDGLEVARSSFTSAGSTFLTGNAATACVNGSYQGTATATVTFPSGHVPTSETRRKTSKRITIAC